MRPAQRYASIYAPIAYPKKDLGLGVIVQDRGLSEHRTFFGSLHAMVHSTQITFSARIADTGKVEFDFGAILLTQETSFIKTCWNGKGDIPGHFSLFGKSADGIEFKTEDLYFNSLGNKFTTEDGSSLNPVGGCSRAEFHCKLQEPALKPQVNIRLKGFRNFHQLVAESRLGTIVMDGEASINDSDTITGYIAVQPEEQPADLATWRTDADKLLEHVRRVMSFASATVLKAPIIEFRAGNDLEVVALSQTKQAPASMCVFHFLNQQPVFDAAVTSFFNPPVRVKNLFFAIEWFSMDATYKEVRLVNAMTALENLVASNLTDEDALIRLPKEFEKIRRKLRQIIKECVGKWPPESEEAAEVVKDLNEKLLDLNRRSILKKMKALAELWGVPLDGISEKKIVAAKRARDRIVHRGHYYGEGNEASDDLWEHIAVIREIVVRFLLSAIGYKGSYFSYLGGYHQTQFPPQADMLNVNSSLPESKEH